jgi:hypothetical protein
MTFCVPPSYGRKKQRKNCHPERSKGSSWGYMKNSYYIEICANQRYKVSENLWAISFFATLKFEMLKWLEVPENYLQFFREI